MYADLNSSCCAGKYMQADYALNRLDSLKPNVAEVKRKAMV
jgi:hypothetical protein